MTTETPAVRQLEVNGIRTLHLSRPGPTLIALHVGVGWADETYSTRGVTHVVEHLAMSAVRRGTFAMNASVTPVRTTFWASGRPEQVTDFVADLVGALNDLPLDRLSKEKDVLDAESGGWGPHEMMLRMRYGNRGLGLGVFTGLGERATDPEVVTEHVRRWFVRENAVLTVAGELPDGWRVGLPSGTVPARAFPESGRPGSVTSGDVDDVVLSFVAPDRPEVLLAVRVMTLTLEESLRHEHGLVYGLAPDIVRLPGDDRVVAQLAAQVAPGKAKQVAEALAAELKRRAQVGVTAEEVAVDLEWWDAASDEPDAGLADLDINAERLLSGRPVTTDAEARRAVAATDPAAVAAVLREALPTAMLLAPTGAGPDDTLPDGAGCALVPALTVPALSRRLRSAAPRGTVLGFGGGVVQRLDPDGEVHEIALDECVGVGVDCGARMLLGARGCIIWIDPKEFRGTDAVVRAVDAGTPSGVRFDLG